MSCSIVNMKNASHYRHHQYSPRENNSHRNIPYDHLQYKNSIIIKHTKFEDYHTDLIYNNFIYKYCS